jgi:hypothetical protein
MLIHFQTQIEDACLGLLKLPALECWPPTSIKILCVLASAAWIRQRWVHWRECGHSTRAYDVSCSAHADA